VEQLRLGCLREKARSPGGVKRAAAIRVVDASVCADRLPAGAARRGSSLPGTCAGGAGSRRRGYDVDRPTDDSRRGRGVDGSF